jgi:midasin (ATPase involved in ribosome maturation)
VPLTPTSRVRVHLSFQSTPSQRFKTATKKFYNLKKNVIDCTIKAHVLCVSHRLIFSLRDSARAHKFTFHDNRGKASPKRRSKSPTKPESPGKEKGKGKGVTRRVEYEEEDDDDEDEEDDDEDENDEDAMEEDEDEEEEEEAGGEVRPV